MAFEEIVLPNVKKIFVPDPGYVMFDCDLAGADAQVVAWEAGDEDLKAAFRAGIDVHSKNAEDMWGTEFTRLPKDSHARWLKRQDLKKGVHATNYVTTPKTMAVTLNMTLHEADRFQKRWFSIHPKIKDWQKRKRYELDTTKTCINGLGYRRVFFDRPDECFPEFVAWSPQSTVALVSFHGAIQLESRHSYVEVLLQNHDSVVFQIPKLKTDLNNLRQIQTDLLYPVPFDDPLTIPIGLKSSEVSWGDCAEVHGL